jgi:hypothetical protein
MLGTEIGFAIALHANKIGAAVLKLIAFAFFTRCAGHGSSKKSSKVSATS